MRLRKENSFQESVDNAQSLLNDGIRAYCDDNYKVAVEKFSLAHKIFLAYKDIRNVSVCLSLNGLMKYLLKEENYYKSLLLLEDSKFLAESGDNKLAGAVNKFSFGQIYFKENKYNEAVFYLSYAVENLSEIPALRAKAYELLSMIYMKSQNAKQAFDSLENAMKFAENQDSEKLRSEIKELSVRYADSNTETGVANVFVNKNTKEKEQNASLLLALTEIARCVNAQANLDELLITIAEQTKKVLNADRCSVFLYDKEKNELWSKVALGMNSEEIRFSADKGFAGHVVKTGETIRIQDAYNDSRFNKEIDKHTGYKTYNLLCMPVRNIKFEIIGAFQVLNKTNGDFTDSDEEILFAIGTNAGIAIENNILFTIQQKMLEDQKKLFEGFINTLAASIDARDKITQGHSNRVRIYSELICNVLGLNKDVTEIISKAARLHDIGKIGIRDCVLQKKGALTKEEYEHIKEHVKITYDILCKTNINASFSEITEIAASHHEKYDGTGYFRGLKGEKIPLGGRILAVSDVFDAITSVRHYRDRMPMVEALKIMTDGKNKHFDGKIVDAFLSVSCDVITDILISDYHLQIKEKDRKLLASVTLKQLGAFLRKENPSPDEEEIINVFNSYYVRQQEESFV